LSGGPAAPSRRERAISDFRLGARLLACPVCARPVKVFHSGAVVCRKGHSFDLSRSGVLNAAGSSSLRNYPKELFLSRRAVFDAGFYDALTGAAAELIREHAPGELRLLDAGCGEGSLLAGLKDRLGEGIYFGADLSRDAVDLAGRRTEGVCWLAADLAALPFARGAFSVIVNCLAPANYGEFRRLLAAGGILVKVLPGPSYLREIRALANLPEPDDTDRTLAWLERHMKTLSARRVCAAHPLTPRQSLCFYRMTPMTSGLPEPAEADLPKRVTVNLTVVCAGFSGTKK